jgi:hypothetical protein
MFLLQELGVIDKYYHMEILMEIHCNKNSFLKTKSNEDYVLKIKKSN